MQLGRDVEEAVELATKDSGADANYQKRAAQLGELYDMFDGRILILLEAKSDNQTSQIQIAHVGEVVKFCFDNAENGYFEKWNLVKEMTPQYEDYVNLRYGSDARANRLKPRPSTIH